MKHLCENCPQYPCSWTTVKSPNTPQDGYLFPVTPKDLDPEDPEDGFNKEWPTLELHGILGYIWVENECILEIPGW